MKINLLSLLCGRFYTIFDYLEQVKRFISLNPDIEWTWIVHDNSKRPEFKRMVEDVGIPFIYLKDGGGVDEIYEYKTASEKLSRYVAASMNRVREAMPPCDYALLIEDDVVCLHENPIPLMLRVFTLPNIGAVSGSVHCKRLAPTFGALQGHKIEKGKMTPLENLEISRANMTSFGFIMFNGELLDKPFEHNYGGYGKSVDCSYGMMLMERGLDIAYCREIQTRHYYKTLDGIVGFAGEKKPEPEKKLVRKKWNRNGSPLFLYVPEEVELNKELVGAYLKGIPIY